MSFLSGMAQQNLYNWRVGVYGGTSTYFGDLNNRVFNPQHFMVDAPFKHLDYLTYGASVEKGFGNALALKLMWTNGKVASNDRRVNGKNELLTDVDNFGRSLNFSTEVMDLGFIGTFYTDNGKIFSEEAFLSPYISLGIGLTRFDVFGDLFLEDGRQYYYWSDNTIRDLAESDPNASNAHVITQDGVFETNLTALNTELDEGYKTTVLNIPAALGLKLRLGNRFNLNLETQFKYSFTDYLDDVSGAYRVNYSNPLQAYAGNPGNESVIFRGEENGRFNDAYAFTSLSLHYNFGFRKDGFIPPINYTNAVETMDEPVATPDGDTPKSMPTTIIVEQLVLPTQPESVVVMPAETREVEPVKVEILEAEQPTITPETVIEMPAETREVEPVKVEILEAEQPTITPETVIEMPAETREVEPVKVEIIETEQPTIEPETVIVMPAEKTEPVKVEEEITVNPLIFPETKPATEALDGKDLAIAIPDAREVILLGVREDQLDLAKIRTELIKRDAGQDNVDLDVQRLKGELNSIEKDIEFFEQYNNGVAIRANDDYSEPENVEIREATEALKLELTAIRKDLGLGDKELVAPTTEKELTTEQLAKMELESRKRIESLEKEVRELKTEQLKQVKKEEKAVIASDKEAIIIAMPPPDAPAELRYYGNEMYRLNKELEKIEDNKGMPIEESYFEDIQKRTTFIDEQLKALEGVDNSKEVREYNKQLKKNIRQLNTALRNLQREEDLRERLVKENEKAVNRAEDLVKPAAIDPTRPVKPSVVPVPIEKPKPIEVETPAPVVPTATPKESTALPEKEEVIVKMDEDYKSELVQLRQEIEKLRSSQESADQAALQKMLERMASLEAEMKNSNRAKENEAPTAEMLALVKSLEALQAENKRLEEAQSKPPVVVIAKEESTAKEAIRGYEVTNIFFDKGRSVIKEEFVDRLDRVAYFMMQYPEIRAQVKGYTDKSGSAELNFRLSRHRANQVKAYLIRQGISSERIDDAFYGSSEATHTDDPYSRRVALTLVVY